MHRSLKSSKDMKFLASPPTQVNETGAEIGGTNIKKNLTQK